MDPQGFGHFLQRPLSLSDLWIAPGDEKRNQKESMGFRKQQPQLDGIKGKSQSSRGCRDPGAAEGLEQGSRKEERLGRKVSRSIREFRDLLLRQVFGCDEVRQLKNKDS